jgi:hypothetical protein
VTGFSIAEIDGLVEGLAPEEPGDPDDDILPSDGGPPRCRPGDLWQLGPHRLICGNALEPGTVAALMNGGRAQMVFTDPPYNVAIQGNVGGLGSIKHREFAMASGEMTRPEFTSFLRTTFTRLVEASVDGSIHFVCMDWRHMAEMHEAADGTYTELKNLIVWAKDNGGMGTFYRSRHELIFASRTEPRRTSTASSSDSTGVIARTSGPIRGRTPSGAAGWKSSRCIRRSSRCS